MLAKDLIEKKRNGIHLTRKEIKWFIDGLTSHEISDEQVGAFAMAVFLKGMTIDEKISLTEAMRDSGNVINWGFDGIFADKHSTGGVGDNVSLMLAPALAACGLHIPMISGRGLGHTGGTLDKFDLILGYDTEPSIDKFKKVVSDVGCAIIGQTKDMAPADKRLYAIRDVTATVESIDLITSSILSKKLASGLNYLVLDVKVGNGAFMPSLNDARELAKSLVSVANGSGCSTSALITDMNEPLCSSVGNSLEVFAAVEFLSGNEIDNRLLEVTCALGGKLLEKSGIAKNFAEGSSIISNVFQNGKALEKFDKMVGALGGPIQLSKTYKTDLPRARFIKEIYHERTGFVGQINTKRLGSALQKLGGARARYDDKIDYAVGSDWLMGVGHYISEEKPVGRIHANKPDLIPIVENEIKAAYQIMDKAPLVDEPILEIVE